MCAHRYPTFCAAAGLSKEQCGDDSPTKPLPVDPSDVAKDIYSNGAWPGLDVRSLHARRVLLEPQATPSAVGF